MLTKSDLLLLVVYHCFLIGWPINQPLIIQFSQGYNSMLILLKTLKSQKIDLNNKSRKLFGVIDGGNPDDDMHRDRKPQPALYDKTYSLMPTAWASEFISLYLNPKHKKTQMKYVLAALLLFTSLFADAQQFKKLKKAKRGESMPGREAIIYGNFIQRLGFSSGGFPQDISLIDINTQERYIFRVKPTYSSSHDNAFCYKIKPGTYAIHVYWWTQSKWYGGKVSIEPIYKGIDSFKDYEKFKAGEIEKLELRRFVFTITENSLNYTGTWDFDKGIVAFRDEKTTLDNALKEKYRKLDFTKANVVLPE